MNVFLVLKVESLSDDILEVKGGGLSERIYFSLIVWAQGQRAVRKPLFNKHKKLEKSVSFWQEDECYDKNFNTQNEIKLAFKCKEEIIVENGSESAEENKKQINNNDEVTLFYF